MTQNNNQCLTMLDDFILSINSSITLQTNLVNRNDQKSTLGLLNSMIGELEEVLNHSKFPRNQYKETTKIITAHKVSASEVPIFSVNDIDLRVGIIRSVTKHPKGTKLYCEEIDVGEESTRSIASGLAEYYEINELQDRRVIVVCNLKPRSLMGFKSNGMVLCASTTDQSGKRHVEFVDPPADSQPGDRIVGDGLVSSPPLSVDSAFEKDAFKHVAQYLFVNEHGVATWNNHALVSISTHNPCTAPVLRKCPIS